MNEPPLNVVAFMAKHVLMRLPNSGWNLLVLSIAELYLSGRTM
jgi:hypothetical protein